MHSLFEVILSSRIFTLSSHTPYCWQRFFDQVFRHCHHSKPDCAVFAFANRSILVSCFQHVFSLCVYNHKKSYTTVFFVCLCMIAVISSFSPWAIALIARYGQWNDFHCFFQHYLSLCHSLAHIYYMSFSGAAVLITVARSSYIFIELHSAFVVSYRLCEHACSVAFALLVITGLMTTVLFLFSVCCMWMYLYFCGGFFQDHDQGSESGTQTSVKFKDEVLFVLS